jgi:hypothetical protein
MPEILATRRGWLAASAALLAGCAGSGGAVNSGPSALSADALLADLERRSFDYFWDLAHPVTGLIPDRWPGRGTPGFASVAAVGFGLSAYPIGVARGWISREQACERTLRTLAFLHEAPQGPAATQVAGHRGFFYHFLDMASGHRYGRTELSSVDTALLLAGALHAAAFFDAAHADEARIRRLAQALYARVEWPWMQVRGALVSMGWHPESGFIAHDWTGYNEAMIVLLLALGAPAHRVGPEAWDAWCATYESRHWGSHHGQTYLQFTSFFGHQFTHAWVDFRGLADAYMRAKGLDYFENSRRATLAQRQYAIDNPLGWAGYGADAWGVTACDGPLDVQRPFGGRLRTFRSYAGRGIGKGEAYDDGTLAPYGAGSSLPFAPGPVREVLHAMHGQRGEHIYGRYGFYAFNPSFTFTDAKLLHGSIVPGQGWVNDDFLGIEVGPLLLMLANHRDEAVWRALRGQGWLVDGLKRAGFRGGWLG